MVIVAVMRLSSYEPCWWKAHNSTIHHNKLAKEALRWWRRTEHDPDSWCIIFINSAALPPTKLNNLEVRAKADINASGGEILEHII